jgi:hypothetical protein
MDPVLAEALRAIGEEGETPQTMAEHHKARGNEFFKKGRMNKMYFVHAVQSYTVRCLPCSCGCDDGTRHLIRCW